MDELYYSDHPELAEIHKQHPGLSSKECEDLRNYQMLYKKYSRSNAAKDKAIARGIKKKIDDLLLRGRTEFPYIGTDAAQDT